jgi:hypothetical protein
MWVVFKAVAKEERRYIYFLYKKKEDRKKPDDTRGAPVHCFFSWAL